MLYGQRSLLIISLLIAVEGTVALSAQLPGEEMIARVNTLIITRSEYDQRREFLRRNLERKFAGAELGRELAAKERGLLKTIIEDQLLAQRAQALDLWPDIEVIKELDSIRRKHNLNDIEAVGEWMVQQGIDPQEFQHDLKQESLRKKVLGKEAYAQAVPPIADEEVGRYFESHQKDFARGNGRGASLEEVRHEIQQSISKARTEQAVDEYFGTLRKQSVIKIKPGYIDTGTTYTHDIDRDLLIAARIGESATIQDLLAKGAHPNTRANDDYTSLMYAAEMGHSDAVRILLGNGANPSLKTQLDFTALMAAVMEKQVDILRALLAAGADVNAKGDEGKTALIWASGEGHSEIVKILLTNHADTGLEDSYGKTALIYAAGEGFRDIMEALLASGANTNGRDSDGKTALLYAVIGGHLDIATSLLSMAADGNASDSEGKTVLIYATLGGYAEIVRALLVSGADVNASDANGETALMYAAARGDKRTVQALLEGGPNLDLESKTSGLTAFKIAAMNGHNEIAELLKRAGARESR